MQISNNFNQNEAYNHVRLLSFPRESETEGEKKAQQYINGYLLQNGIKATFQPFTFSSLGDVLTRILPCIYGCVLLGVSIQYTPPSMVLFVFFGTLFFLTLVSSIISIPIDKIHTLFNHKRSNNICGSIAAQNTSQYNLIFSAHYDSKSQFLPIALRAMCFFMLLFSSILLLGIHIYAHINPFHLFVLIQKITGFLAASSGVILLLNKTGNRSNGAADNASGVATLLELARIFRLNPLKNTSLHFVFTGAEEYSMAGAFWYINHTSFLKENSFFINIDSISGNRPFAIIKGKRPHKKSPQNLWKTLQKQARLWSLPTLVVSNPLGIGFDHIAFALKGYATVSLSSLNLSMLWRIHSTRDTINHISSHNLGRIGLLCEKFAHKLDQGIK